MYSKRKHACKVAKTFDIWSEIASKRRAKGVLTPASDCACQSRSSSQQPAQTAARQQPSVRPFAAHPPPPTRCTAPHLTVNTLTVASPPSAPPAYTRPRRRPCYSRPLPREILPIGGLTRGCAGPPRPHTTHPRPPLPPIPPKCTADAARKAARRLRRKIGMSSTMSSPWTTSTWSQMASVRTTPGKRTSVIARIRPYAPSQHTIRTTRI